MHEKINTEVPLEKIVERERNLALQERSIMAERLAGMLDVTECRHKAEEHEQLVELLEELKNLREYKERMELQFLDDIDNPLEPLKLQKALESEIFKYTYRSEHNPDSISPLDYTIMYALKHCLEEYLREDEEKNFFNFDSPVVDVDKKSYLNGVDDFKKGVQLEYENITNIPRQEKDLVKKILNDVSVRIKDEVENGKKF